jgi:hypothetical protein
MNPSIAQTDFYGSVANWLEELSPETIAQFSFTTYNSLLSNVAVALMVRADFPENAGDPETEIIQNIRVAMAELYAGSTCTLTPVGNGFALALAVPGGDADTWPAQIPQPGPIIYPYGQIIGAKPAN